MTKSSQISSGIGELFMARVNEWGGTCLFLKQGQVWTIAMNEKQH